MTVRYMHHPYLTGFQQQSSGLLGDSGGEQLHPQAIISHEHVQSQPYECEEEYVSPPMQGPYFPYNENSDQQWLEDPWNVGGMQMQLYGVTGLLRALSLECQIEKKKLSRVSCQQESLMASEERIRVICQALQECKDAQKAGRVEIGSLRMSLQDCRSTLANIMDRVVSNEEGLKQNNFSLNQLETKFDLLTHKEDKILQQIKELSQRTTRLEQTKKAEKDPTPSHKENEMAQQVTKLARSIASLEQSHKEKREEAQLRERKVNETIRQLTTRVTDIEQKMGIIWKELQKVMALEAERRSADLNKEEALLSVLTDPDSHWSLLKYNTKTENRCKQGVSAVRADAVRFFAEPSDENESDSLCKQSKKRSSELFSEATIPASLPMKTPEKFTITNSLDPRESGSAGTAVSGTKSILVPFSRYCAALKEQGYYLVLEHKKVPGKIHSLKIL